MPWTDFVFDSSHTSRRVFNWVVQNLRTADCRVLGHKLALLEVSILQSQAFHTESVASSAFSFRISFNFIEATTQAFSLLRYLEATIHDLVGLYILIGAHRGVVVTAVKVH